MSKKVLNSSFVNPAEILAILFACFFEPNLSIWCLYSCYNYRSISIIIHTFDWPCSLASCSFAHWCLVGFEPVAVFHLVFVSVSIEVKREVKSASITTSLLLLLKHTPAHMHKHTQCGFCKQYRVWLWYTPCHQHYEPGGELLIGPDRTNYIQWQIETWSCPQGGGNAGARETQTEIKSKRQRNIEYKYPYLSRRCLNRCFCSLWHISFNIWGFFHLVSAPCLSYGWI